jgi:hypothetical protein
MTVPCSVDRLSSYLDGELSSRQERQLEIHLESCDSCRRELEGLRRVVSRLRRLEHQSPPSSVTAALERSLAGERLGRDRSERFARLPGEPAPESTLLPWFALVVALVAVLLIFLQAVDRRREQATRILAPEAPRAEQEAPERGEADPPIRLMGGRELRYRQGIWLEKGVASGSEAETIVVTADGANDPRLADLGGVEELRSLGAPVRLRLGGEVVELRFDP